MHTVWSLYFIADERWCGYWNITMERSEGYQREEKTVVNNGRRHVIVNIKTAVIYHSYNTSELIL